MKFLRQCKQFSVVITTKIYYMFKIIYLLLNVFFKLIYLSYLYMFSQDNCNEDQTRTHEQTNPLKDVTNGKLS